MNSSAQQKLNTVVALFKSHTPAELAVKELQKADFDMKQLSIVERDYHTEEHVVGYYNAGDRMNLRKYLNAAVWIGGTIVTASALADTQQGGSGMMDGYGTGWMGGYGGIWIPILLVAVVAGLVGWIIAQKKK